MKQLLLLAPLLILIGCVEGGLSHPQLNSSRIVNQYRKNLELKLGTVEFISRQGSDLDFGTYSGKAGFKQVPIDQEINAVIIKIDGAEVYKYQEISDKISGKKKRRVSLQKFDPIAEMAHILDSRAGYIEGSYLYFKGSNQSQKKEESYTYTERVSFIGRIDLDFAHCSYATESKKTGTLKNLSTSLSTLTAVALDRSICGQPLSVSEIKSIDLNNIELCDERRDIVSCRPGQDLSALTNDL